MKLAATANRVAQYVYNKPISCWIPQDSVIRDACDTATGGDLSTAMLDRLCRYGRSAAPIANALRPNIPAPSAIEP